MSGSPGWGQLLDSILKQGSHLIVARFATQEKVLAKTHALLFEGVQALQGANARHRLESQGLSSLHEILPAEQIGPLRDHVMPQLRPDLLSLACNIGRQLLGIEGEFFVDDYTILRINYPYLAALQASNSAENPGIGRTAEQSRRESKASQPSDPVYDPKAFHNHEPPPAWAHGAHQDTWTGHSRLGVNLWWAVDDVSDECSMVFYPETFGRHFVPDPRSLYLHAGQPLPKPTNMALRRGEMLIFNPEMLHGTHLNTTNQTRLALSTRLNPRQPKFDQSCFYAREFWHSSVNIEAGAFDRVIRFMRAENLESETGDAAPPVFTQPRAIAPLVDTKADSDWQPVCDSGRLASGQKLIIRVNGGEDILVTRGHRQLRAVQARCPHLQASLADGHHCEDAIWCPVHAVRFSLADGRSSCPALTLRTYAVREEHGIVWLRPISDILDAAPDR